MNDGYALSYWQDRSAQIIEAYDSDPESAHSDEDALLAEFIEALAGGLVQDPSAAARVLKRALLDRGRVRWYA